MALFVDDLIWIVVLAFIIAFVLAFGIGANDVANTFGTTVGAKVLTLVQACILATIFETLGAILIGAKVSNTIRKGMLDLSLLSNKTVSNVTVDYKIVMFGHLSALSGSCIWLLLATFLKLPVSTTHSIVGAVVGYAMLSLGPKGVKWWEIGKIVLSWFVSPVLSGAVSVLIFFLTKKFILDKADPLEPGLSFLPYIYAITLFVNSFSVFYDGPKLLYFHEIPWWGAIILAVGIGVITGIVVRLVLVPWQRRHIHEETDAFKSNNFLMASNGTMDPDAAIAFQEKVNLNETNPLDTSGVAEDKPEQARLFSWLQVLMAVFGSFAHGGNDVSNAIGPLIGIWLTGQSMNVTTYAESPLYLLAYGGAGISLGLWILGRRVIQTVGSDLTKITPSSGSCIELGSALTVLVASNIGLPVSTTHCKVGSVVLVGWFRSRTNVNWRIFINIVMAWVVTLPVSALLSAFFMFIFLKTNSPSLI